MYGARVQQLNMARGAGGVALAGGAALFGAALLVDNARKGVNGVRKDRKKLKRLEAQQAQTEHQLQLAVRPCTARPSLGKESLSRPPPARTLA